MKNARIFKTDDGSVGLYNEELDEIYHSREGAQTESIEKFIIPSDFERRTKNSDCVRVLDVCYGIGYNSKNALCFYENSNIIIDALEWDLELVEYSKTADFHNPEINEFLRGEKSLGGSKINFYIQDARKTVQMLNTPYDVIFLDAFAPNKLPTLWSVEFFAQLKRLLLPSGVLVTYCSAQPVRHAMILNNLYLAKLLNEKNHSCATAAVSDKKLIKSPLVKLDETELGLINTKAAIPYRDENLNSSAEDMLKRRENEVKNSNLEGASSYLKRTRK